MKCLVTGFEAFEGVDENPTEKIARELPKTLEGVALEVEILPSSMASLIGYLLSRVIKTSLACLCLGPLAKLSLDGWKCKRSIGRAAVFPITAVISSRADHQSRNIPQITL